MLIPKKEKIKAYNLVKDVDLNDIAFVALNEYKQALLWTGDKVLINGLKAKAYDRIITTEEMINLRLELEK
jgi:predicted nucleic acid-binding protein